MLLSAVFLANFRGTKVAVKRLHSFEEDRAGDGGALSPSLQPVLSQFFEREIEILATIRHPNVRAAGGEQGAQGERLI